MMKYIFTMLLLIGITIAGYNYINRTEAAGDFTIEPVTITYGDMVFELEPGQELTLTPKSLQSDLDKIEALLRNLHVTQELFFEASNKLPEIVTIEHYTVEQVGVEKIVYKNYTWRDFESVDGFKAWFVDQDFLPLAFLDCDDYALRLQRTAHAQGYYISVALTSDGKIYGKQVTKPNHVGNLILIKNIFYWVEPEPKNFVVTKIVNRD